MYVAMEDVESIVTTAATMSVCANKDECIGMQRMQRLVIDALRDIPAADVRENVHGYWKSDARSVFNVFCSVCDYESGVRFKFCPCCSAIMDGDDESRKRSLETRFDGLTAWHGKIP